MSGREQSHAFELLNEKVKRWIWQQNWNELRDVQEEAIKKILAEQSDIIISSATASGKTEAAFLPICSKMLEERASSFAVIYIGPLRALINDQFSRIDMLCKELEIPVHPWHGDISSSIKKKFLNKPSGILLITPESLEAIFVNHGHLVGQLFAGLRYIIVDELHSFIATERGKQLQSLLHRAESVLKRKVPRIGLSATLGDMGAAADYLRPEDGESVSIITDSGSSQEVKLMIHGYQNMRPEELMSDSEDDMADLQDEEETSFQAISDHLFATLRGENNLIFANSRNKVELYADSLRRMCEQQFLPNEFCPHHGSLSKDLREFAESSAKTGDTPVTIVCTTTLEMGIDIGAMKSIAQIGTAPSVSSMRQRLGRSGRRGDPSVLRIYVDENELTANSPPPDRLHSALVQSIAMVNLLVQKWCEPKSSTALNLSTLIHQILSLIAQRGGITAQLAWKELCVRGPFYVTENLFMDLLRSMGKAELIMQESGGLLLPGETGERIINHYSFYAVFFTPEEFRLVCEGQILGTLPIDRPLQEGAHLIFAGKRWYVRSVDLKKKIIELVPAKGGRPPKFGGQAGWVHGQIRQEMFRVYSGDDMPLFIDKQSKELLREARSNFKELKLYKKRIIQDGNSSYMFCWRGDKTADTIAIMLRTQGIAADNEGIAIVAYRTPYKELCGKVRELVNKGEVDAVKLASKVKNKIIEKYDIFLPEHLLNINYASSRLDVAGALKALQEVSLDH